MNNVTATQNHQSPNSNQLSKHSSNIHLEEQKSKDLVVESIDENYSKDTHAETVVKITDISFMVKIVQDEPIKINVGGLNDLMEEFSNEKFANLIIQASIGNRLVLLLDKLDLNVLEEIKAFRDANPTADESDALKRYYHIEKADAFIKMVYDSPPDGTIKYRFDSKDFATRFGNASKKDDFPPSIMRQRYILELLHAGLFLSIELSPNELYDRFIYLYTPYEALAKEAEFLKCRYPLKEEVVEKYIEGYLNINITPVASRPYPSFLSEPGDMRKQKRPATLKRSTFFQAEHVFDFEGADSMEKVKSEFFTPEERSSLFYSIITKVKLLLEEHRLKELSILQLLHIKVFTDLYSNHLIPKNSKNPAEANIVDRLLKWSVQVITMQPIPLQDIRNYFGESVGFYFAWLDFFTSWFLYTSFLSIPFIIYGSIYTTTSTAYGQFDNVSTPLFAFIISVWSLVYIKCWERRTSYLSFIWDVDRFRQKESIRIEFRPLSTRNSKVTGKVEGFVPRSIRRRIRCVGRILTFFCFLVLIAVVGAAVYAAVAFSSTGYAGAISISSAVTITQIFVFGPVFWIVSLWINDFENFRLNSNYNNAFIWKIFLLNFANCYALLIFSAIIKPVITDLNIGPFSCQKLGNTTDCLQNLVLSIAMIFCGTQFLTQVLSIYYPIFMERKISRNHRMQTKRKWVGPESENGKPVSETVSPFVKESDFLVFTGDLFQNDYCTKVTTLGYVLLFSSPFPLASFFSWLGGCIEMKVSLYKRLKLYRRTFSEEANSIGSWDRVIKLIVHMGILSNAVLISFTANGVQFFFNSYSFDSNYLIFIKVSTIVIFQNLLLAVAYFIDTISAVPHEVKAGRLAEAHIERVRFNGDVERIRQETEKRAQKYDKLFKQSSLSAPAKDQRRSSVAPTKIVSSKVYKA